MVFGMSGTDKSGYSDKQNMKMHLSSFTKMLVAIQRHAIRQTAFHSTLHTESYA